MKKILFVIFLTALNVCISAQSTAKRHGLTESEVTGFYIINDDTNFQPENGGIDFTADNYFVIRGRNLTAREIKTRNGSYYLVTDKDEPDGWLYNARYFPAFIDNKDLPDSLSKNSSLRSKTVWRTYPGDGKYDVFFTISPSAGIIIVGFKAVK
jgi:hypothetical protein